MKKISLLRAAAAICAVAMAVPLFAACTEESDISSQPSQTESSQTEPESTVTVGEAVYEIKNPVNTEVTESGVYLFTADYGKNAVSKGENGDFFDVVVIDGVAVDISGKGESAVIPAEGCLLRFYGMSDANVTAGDKVECDLDDAESNPAKYVRFGDTVIEIGYENTVRTSEDTGWLYDSRWYSGTTTNNVYCTEIAVQDGRIVEINRSGDSIADTVIPEGGYVVAVGQGGSNENKTKKLNVGDTAELFIGEKLYNVKRFGFSGINRSRPDDGMVLFNTEDKSTTPIGNNLTEVLVNKNGKITAVYENCSGMNKIPEGGFIISATGAAATSLTRVSKVGASVLQTDKRVIYIVSTPKSNLELLKKEYEALKNSFSAAVNELAYIDYKGLDALLAEIEDIVSSVNTADGESLADGVIKLQSLVPQAQAELIPQITVQDRAAWVTLGEYNYDNSLLLHYKTQESVDHTVAYAKSVGLNTLIIDNLAAGFAVYDSRVPGIVKLPQLGELDLLEAFKTACDEQGLRLIIMVNAFSSGLNNVAYPADHYMSIYKDKYLLTNKGNHVGPDNYITLDPADRDVQAFNLAVLAEICENYDVYGVQADYMRYPLPYYYQEHNYEDFGYNESSVSGFIKKYGKDPATIKISDPLWEKWCAWRRDIISDYQKQFYETAKGINPNLNVSFTCFADYRDRQLYTYQDVEKWAENGYADAIYPMIYGETTEHQLGYAQEILPVTEHTDLVLGVGTYVKATHESMNEQLIMSYDVCAEGISVFTLRYISICGYDEVYRAAFRTPATPATAPDALLVPAAAEMLVKRMDNLVFASEVSGADGSSIEALSAAVSDIDTAKITFADFCAQLEALRQSFDSSAGDSADNISQAALHALDYILGLQ